jgi:hypothetical protein
MMGYLSPTDGSGDTFGMAWFSLLGRLTFALCLDWGEQVVHFQLIEPNAGLEFFFQELRAAMHLHG